MKFSLSDPAKHEATLAYSYVRLQSIPVIQQMVEGIRRFRKHSHSYQPASVGPLTEF